MKLSVIIPAYNEESVVRSDLEPLIKWLSSMFRDFEIVLVENGSTDKTYSLAKRLASKWPCMRVLHLETAGFGNAVRQGILDARGSVGVLLNADWLDREFIAKAVPMLDECDIVIGSKVLNTRLDKRPIYRKMASKLLTLVLSYYFGFKHSDSHGLKAFRIDVAQKLMGQCELNEIIESEFLLLAEAGDYRIDEVAVAIIENRPPRVSFVRRIFSMAHELTKMNRLKKRLKHASAR